MKITTYSAQSAQDMANILAQHAFQFVSVHMNCALDAAPLRDLSHIPALHGATSCLGAMTNVGTNNGVVAFAIDDAEGAYGTAMVPYENDPQEAARQATLKALSRADRMGERPEIIWVSGTPGVEEAVLAGIESVTGTDVPIIGGSAADNSVAGDWFVFDDTLHSQAGVVVSVLFPSAPVSFAYQNGYSPTAHSGVVTQVEGRRIKQIDGRPALDVYSGWTGGQVVADPAMTEPQTILSASTLWPLGREIAQVGDVPFYLLAHPAMAQMGGEMDLFATVDQGETLTLMSGTIEGLVDRAGRVATLARASGRAADRPIAGALMIYCGGCMLTVRDELPKVVKGVDAALDGAPFAGAFTFGEQGALVGAGNRHGNLMISCIVFG